MYPNLNFDCLESGEHSRIDKVGDEKDGDFGLDMDAGGDSHFTLSPNQTTSTMSRLPIRTPSNGARARVLLCSFAQGWGSEVMAHYSHRRCFVA